MGRACGYVVVMAILLAGCGGGADGDGGAAGPDASTSSSPTSSGDTETSTDPFTEPSTEPGDTAVPDETDRPTDSGGNGGDDSGGNSGGEDERVLEVAGPTLDNTYPTNPFALPRVGGSSCILLSNRLSDVAVTVDSVKLINLQPTGNPGLALGDAPNQHPQCVNAPSEQTWTVRATCVGARLEPDAASACPVEVRSTGTVGTDYTARLVLRLSATCTTPVGEPCDRLVGRATPTPAEPVTVTWEFSRRYSSCLVPRDRDGAEFLPEEADGGCPSTTPTPSPSESPLEPGSETPSDTTTASPSDG